MDIEANRAVHCPIAKGPTGPFTNNEIQNRHTQTNKAEGKPNILMAINITISDKSNRNHGAMGYGISIILSSIPIAAKSETITNFRVLLFCIYIPPPNKKIMKIVIFMTKLNIFTIKKMFFFHPDYTVGIGIPPIQQIARGLSPPVGNYTLP